MEKSVTIEEFLAYYRACMEQGPVDPGSCSPLILAYIGDAVYEIMVRMKVISGGNTQMSRIHKKSSSLVKAANQAALIIALEERLTPEEHAVYKRGRNAKSGTTAKNASVTDYRMATGFEALVGWLFLAGRYERLTELVSEGLKKLDELESACAAESAQKDHRESGEVEIE